VTVDVTLAFRNGGLEFVEAPSNVVVSLRVESRLDVWRTRPEPKPRAVDLAVHPAAVVSLRSKFHETEPDEDRVVERMHEDRIAGFDLLNGHDGFCLLPSNPTLRHLVSKSNNGVSESAYGH